MTRSLPLLASTLLLAGGGSLLSSCTSLCSDYCDQQPIDCERAAEECEDLEKSAATDDGGSEVEDLDMKAWRDEFGDQSGSPASDPPQYSDGTVGILPGAPPSQVGTVTARPNSGGTMRWEGHLTDDLSTYTGQLPVQFVQLDTTPMTIAAFDALYAKDMGSDIPCGASDDECLAQDEFTYVTLPATVSFPNSLPGGATARVTQVISNKDNATCDGSHGSDYTEVGGWLYRVRVVDSGQVKWTEMWFLKDDRTEPDECDGTPGDVEWWDKHDNANTSPPVPRTFVSQLRQSSCTGGDPIWCGYCDQHTCDYAILDLDWYQQAP